MSLPCVPPPPQYRPHGNIHANTHRFPHAAGIGESR